MFWSELCSMGRLEDFMDLGSRFGAFRMEGFEFEGFRGSGIRDLVSGVG